MSTVSPRRQDRPSALWPNLTPRRLARLIDRLRHRASPSHWSFLFGIVSLACLVVLIVTGVILMFFYEPSSATLAYRGRYPLLQGVEMSEAFASILRISFDVNGGLLVRQAHHWAALVLPAALILQLLSTFFTGAFRKPRRLSWLLLFGIFVLALVAGWSGYALPDDMLSATGLRIAQGVALGIPVVGTPLAWILFGGEFPGRIIPTLYGIHLVAPALLVVLLAVRLRLSWRQRPPQFPGPGRTEDNVVGVPMWPTMAAKAAGLFFLTAGVLTLMAGTLTISPVWLYGPAAPGSASAGSQPDWYTGFLDGALRLVPAGWEFVWLGRTWTLAVLVPLAAVGLFLALVGPIPSSRAGSWPTDASTISSTGPATHPPGPASGPQESRSTAPCGRPAARTWSPPSSPCRSRTSSVPPRRGCPGPGSRVRRDPAGLLRPAGGRPGAAGARSRERSHPATGQRRVQRSAPAAHHAQQWRLTAIKRSPT